VAVLPAVSTSIDIACARVAGVGVGVGSGACVGVEVAVDVGVAVGVEVGVEVGVAVAVEVGGNVGVDVGSPTVWTTNSTLFVAASSELNWYPSLLALSIASEMDEPAPAATAEVTSTSAQNEIAAPGVNVRIVALRRGVAVVECPSVQVSSATALTFCRPLSRWSPTCSLADWTVCPASDCRPNFRYVARIGDESDCKTAAAPKLLEEARPPRRHRPPG
jgi:hypothetical protein